MDSELKVSHVSFAEMLFLVFLHCKLMGAIQWHWVVVATPAIWAFVIEPGIRGIILGFREALKEVAFSEGKKVRP